MRLRQKDRPVPPELEAQVAEADATLFSKLRAMLGLDQALAVNVGAAPTPVDVLGAPGARSALRCRDLARRPRRGAAWRRLRRPVGNEPRVGGA